MVNIISYILIAFVAVSLIVSSIMIAISVVLTAIAGFIPAKMASKKDPVEALRSE